MRQTSAYGNPTAGKELWAACNLFDFVEEDDPGGTDPLNELMFTICDNRNTSLSLSERYGL